MFNLLKTLNSISKRFFNTFETPKYLGRWKIENEYKTNLKADYANDDHCGVCSFVKKIESDDDTYESEEYYSVFLIESLQDVDMFKKKE